MRGSKFHRFIDRYLGICFLFFVAALNRLLYPRSQHFSKIKKSVLVIQIGAIGDSVLSLPALRLLREQGYEVTVLCEKTIETIFLLDNFQVQHLGLNNAFKNPLRLLKTIFFLRKQDFGWIIDFLPWPKVTGVIAGLLRSRYNCLVGFSTQGHLRAFIYDVTVEHSSKLHESQNYEALIRTITPGAPPISNFIRPLIITTPLNVFSKVGLDKNEPYLVIHPWGSGYRARDREWPLFNYGAIQRYFGDKFRLVVTGSSHELQKSMEFPWSDQTINTVGKLSLLETMYLLASAKGVLTVNTGILHLASWLNRPIVALNGPTNSHRWGALKQSVDHMIINLNASSPCSPCLNLGFEYKCKQMYCMPTIATESVVSSLELILAPPVTTRNKTQLFTIYG